MSAPGRPKREGTPARASGRRVGVIGTGAMGGGVVQSLVRAGVATSARDIRAEAQALAVRHGAAPTASPADLARACEVIVLLVVDAAQIETVLFGADGGTAPGRGAQGGACLWPCACRHLAASSIIRFPSVR